MFKTSVLLSAIVAISSTALAAPRDLVDQADEQFAELQAIVQGEISAAHNKLSDLLTEFRSEENSVLQNGLVDIDQHKVGLLDDIRAIKNLAEAAGKDVSSCTEIREDTIKTLSARFLSTMKQCIADVDDDAVKVERDSRYLVDVYINKIHDLGNQLKKCQGELLCISSILTEIELNKIRLSQNIGTEVQATESLLNVMKLSMMSCGNDNFSAFVIQGNIIFKEIEACANEIIG